MHSHARLYTIEARIAFTACGALLLLVFALPASLSTGRPSFRSLVRILAAVILLCAAALLVAKIWMQG
jgi:hypothetical protein